MGSVNQHLRMVLFTFITQQLQPSNACCQKTKIHDSTLVVS